MRPKPPERQGEKLSQKERERDEGKKKKKKNSICPLAHRFFLFPSPKLPSLSLNSNQAYSRGGNFCLWTVLPPSNPEEDLNTLAKRDPVDISNLTGKRKKKKKKLSTGHCSVFQLTQ